MFAGDRAMFHLLTNLYKANMTLPAPLPNQLPHTLNLRQLSRNPPGPPGQANGYAYLAYTDHRDLWFAWVFFFN